LQWQAAQAQAVLSAVDRFHLSGLDTLSIELEFPTRYISCVLTALKILNVIM
jgi:hypothetical protein